MAGMVACGAGASGASGRMGWPILLAGFSFSLPLGAGRPGSIASSSPFAMSLPFADAIDVARRLPAPRFKLSGRSFEVNAVMPVVLDELPRLFERDPVGVGKIFDIGFAHCRHIARLIGFPRLRCHGRPCKCTLPAVNNALPRRFVPGTVQARPLDADRMVLIIAHGVYIVTAQVLTEP